MISTDTGVSWADRLQEARCVLRPQAPRQIGRLVRAVGLTLEASGLSVALGTRCEILIEKKAVRAEVVGFSEKSVHLMPLDEMQGLTAGQFVMTLTDAADPPVGDVLLGRIVDSTGYPYDNKGPLSSRQTRSMHTSPVNPLEKSVIKKPLDVGVRSINGLLPIGLGQRIGLFAGSGVGKSQLMGMITRNTNADVVVIGLIGERGREVKAFVEDSLDEESLSRTVVVAAPADHTALRRLQGASMATTVAEHFRDQGKHVLLLMDSLTRFAQAQREIGLAIGEPPSTKGYPPSVFQKIPELVERAGVYETGGSITAIYTVLVEDDIQSDPVADAARAVLDGHIVLSRSIAESGIYPALDLESSISRVSTNLTSPEHQSAISRFRALVSLYKSNSDVVNLGIYKPGGDPELDQAVRAYPELMDYLKQMQVQSISRQDSIDHLIDLMNRFPAVADVA